MLLSENGEAMGFLVAELSLDKNGDWKIGPMQKTVAFLEDLQKETAPRFKFHKTKEKGHFIEPPENIKSVPPSRLVRELFAEEAGRISATESLPMKLKPKKDEKSSAHPPSKRSS